MRLRNPASGGLPVVTLAEAATRPHLMVDGAPLPTSVLTLSHWPASPTPRPLADDLSTGSVFRWLRSRRRWSRPDPLAVTTDHFDQDSLTALLAASQPTRALALETELMDLARMGDFVRGDSAVARRASSVISGQAETGRGTPADLVGDTLGWLPDLVRDPNPWREFWQDEEGFLEDSRRGLASGSVVVEERPDIDLLIVSVPPGPWRPFSQLGRRRAAPLHPLVLHNRSRLSRVLMIAPPRYELYFRYETWVRLRSPAWAPRIDLTGAAAELGAAEPSGRPWSFNGVRATIARLEPADGMSDLAPDRVRRVLEASLAS